ncbi:hypothetical protein D6D00_01682 [Aureobasidium pullulans]|nr:hypothetical protein D6D00_01682 [Aureobasidium pullulans]
MAENNATEPVPIEAVQEQHEAIITAATAATAAIDLDHSNEDNNDADDASQTSSAYAEENRQVFEEIWLPKITALSTELNAVFEDIKIRWSGASSRIFSLTLRNPPAGALWEDGTQAILRIRNRLHDEQSEFEEKADAEASQLRSGENPHIPESPVSATSNASASSGLSGSTLADESQEDIHEDGLNQGNPDESKSDDDSSSSQCSDITDQSDDLGRDRDEWQWERLDEALVLNLVEDSGILVPRVLAYDITSQNSLGFAYSIQTRAAGDSVQDHYRRRDFSLNDRHWIAGEMAELRVRLETIKFEEAGRLLANEDEEHSSAGKLPLNLSSRANIIQNLIEYELGREHKGRESRIRRYLYIKDIINDMYTLGWFSEDIDASPGSALSYWHQSAEKTLVEKTDDPANPWRVTGFIGWDDSEALPVVLTRAPAAWLWHGFNDDKLDRDLVYYYQGDMDILPVEMPWLTTEDLAIKQRYEDVLVEKLYTPQYGENARARYLDDAYGRGRWLRRVFKFAREGLCRMLDYHRFNAFHQEWNNFMKDKNIQYKGLGIEDGSWPGLPDNGPRMYVPGIQYEPDATETEHEVSEAEESKTLETEKVTLEA